MVESVVMDRVTRHPGSAPPWRRSPLGAGLLALSIALLGGLASAPGPTALAAGDTKAKGEVASELAAYALACAKAGAKTEATRAHAEAKALDAAAPGLAEAQAAIDAVTEDAADAEAAVTEQKKALGPKIAKAYDKLAAALIDPKNGGPSTRALVAALAWEASKPRVAKAVKGMDEAAKANHPDLVARLLAGLERADPETAKTGKFDRAFLDLATSGLGMLGSPGSTLVAFVSLPRDWQKGKTYPVLVGVDGAGSGFQGYANGSKGARGSRSAILVSPCTLSNTNTLELVKYPWYDQFLLNEFDKKRMEFDGPGVDGVLKVLHDRFGGEEKVFVTGFSGGGNWCYWKLFTDPSHVRGACPACANFGNYAGATAQTVADGGPPVQLMTGANDPNKDAVGGAAPGIEGQTDAAQKKLEELGFKKVTRVSLRAGHDPLHAEVWKFFDQVMGAK